MDTALNIVAVPAIWLMALPTWDLLEAPAPLPADKRNLDPSLVQAEAQLRAIWQPAECACTYNQLYNVGTASTPTRPITMGRKL